MDPAETVMCPDCKIPMEASPLSSDPTARVCARCGLDRLGAIMLDIVKDGVLWDYRDADVHLRWKNGQGPDAAEIAAVKKLIPSLRRTPVAHLAQALGGGPTWLLATLRADEARALYLHARRIGLRADIVYLPETRGTSKEPHGDDDEVDEDEHKES